MLLGCSRRFITFYDIGGELGEGEVFVFAKFFEASVGTGVVAGCALSLHLLFFRYLLLKEGEDGLVGGECLEYLTEGF